MAGPLALRIQLKPLSLALGLILSKEALKEATMPLLVAQNLYYHVLRDRVSPFRRLYDPLVVLYSPGLGLYNPFYYVYHVYLVLGGLQVPLLCRKV